MLVVYRDGVSEGQYDMVIEKKLPLSKKACQNIYSALDTKKGLLRRPSSLLESATTPASTQHLMVTPNAPPTLNLAAPSTAESPRLATGTSICRLTPRFKAPPVPLTTLLQLGVPCLVRDWAWVWFCLKFSVFLLLDLAALDAAILSTAFVTTH